MNRRLINRLLSFSLSHSFCSSRFRGAFYSSCIFKALAPCTFKYPITAEDRPCTFMFLPLIMTMYNEPPLLVWRRRDVHLPAPRQMAVDTPGRPIILPMRSCAQAVADLWRAFSGCVSVPGCLVVQRPCHHCRLVVQESPART